MRPSDTQSTTAPAEDPNSHLKPEYRRPQIGLPDSPFLTVAEAARHCRFDDCANPAAAFTRWRRTHAIPVCQRGRRILVERAVLDDALRRIGRA
jgi:hypothetical protein